MGNKRYCEIGEIVMLWILVIGVARGWVGRFKSLAPIHTGIFTVLCLCVYTYLRIYAHTHI